jgi:queuine tRNA-ribosyltransferase
MAQKPNPFTLLRTCGQARRGRLMTPHGAVETPVFMPVGTLGAVKSLDATDMHGLGAQIMLCNAYHMALRPSAPLVQQMGGLHTFMGYKGAILTDSGGFQVFSLAKSRRIDDQGVTFQSHLDGATIRLTPKRLVEVQEQLGPDVAMVIDECPPGQADRATVEAAMARTSRWAEACLDARSRSDMHWFGIVQGGVYDDLRARHADTIGAMPFDGFAIGGVSVGEKAEDIDRVVRVTAPLLPADRARYLMGVGTPEDLVRSVDAGVDMFDCIMPSRNARNGQLFTSTGRLNIKGAAHKLSDAPLDAACSCHTCTHHSRGYLRHLFVAKELTYFRLATLHNVHFYLQLMADIRRRIEQNTFNAQELLAQLSGTAA